VGREDITLREALTEHRSVHGFAPDGGVEDRWAVFRLGPVAFCIPNLSVRRRAMFRHDLNHVVSGYGHDLLGEAETSAWEIGSGCQRYLAAWVLAWSAIVAGVVMAPGRVFAAFVRGRRSANLFGTDLDSVLDQPLVAVRSTLGLSRRYRARPVDLLLFVLVVALGPLVGAIPVGLSILTSPVWLAQGAQRARRGADAVVAPRAGN
jgi:hypothetical protein